MSRACVPDVGLLGEEFFKVWWGVSINALVSYEGNFVIVSCNDGKSVKCVEYCGDVFMFSCSE